MEPDLGRGRRFLEAMRGIATGRALSDVLKEIVSGAVDLAHARYGVLGVPTADRCRYAEFVSVGLDEEAASRIRADPAWPRADVEDVYSAPIPLHGKVIGQLHVVGGGTGELDRQAVHAMAIAAAMALRDARQIEASRRREAWLQASNEITEALLAGMEPGDELPRIAENAREVAGAPIAAIALPHEDKPGILIFEVVQGADQLAGASIAVEGTASGQVFRTGEPLLIDNYGAAAAAWQGEESDLPPGTLKALGSAAIVPLIAGEHILGVLVLCRLVDEPLFEQSDLDLLRNFAAHVALAVRYASARADQERLTLLEDRERIARDLHDLVIQRVFATGMALEAVAAVIPVDPEDAVTRVRHAVDDLDETIQEIRTTVFALQKPEAESLRSLVLSTVDAAVVALGFTPSVRFLGPVDTSVAAEITDQLLPVLREALANVAKHAQATAWSVEVAVNEDLQVRVTDNGVGMPPNGRRSGVANMAVRAQQLGGMFTIELADPGTQLTWRVPLGL
jgi:signal transduction histidine kinase